MWNADKRGRALGIYSLAPLLGPVIGPVAGGWIAEKSTWRWVFRSTSIADAIIQLFGLYFLQESESLTSRCNENTNIIDSLRTRAVKA